MKESEIDIAKFTSPMSDSSCYNYKVTSDFGESREFSTIKNPDGTNRKDIHDGVDYALDSGGSCDIVSASKGKKIHGGGFGNTVQVIHNSIYKTLYGHGAFLRPYKKLCLK